MKPRRLHPARRATASRSPGRGVGRGTDVLVGVAGGTPAVVAVGVGLGSPGTGVLVGMVGGGVNVGSGVGGMQEPLPTMTHAPTREAGMGLAHVSPRPLVGARFSGEPPS